MILCATLEFDKPMPSTPPMSSIYLEIDGQEYCLDWDEAEGSRDTEDKTICYYRHKGVLFDDEYANGFFEKHQDAKVEVTEINFDEDETWDYFEKTGEDMPEIIRANITIFDNELKLHLPTYSEKQKEEVER